MERIETLDHVVPLLVKDIAKNTAAGAFCGFLVGVAVGRPFALVPLSAGIAAGYSWKRSNAFLGKI
jgi:hypothetical protein